MVHFKDMCLRAACLACVARDSEDGVFISLWLLVQCGEVAPQHALKHLESLERTSASKFCNCPSEGTAVRFKEDFLDVSFASVCSGVWLLGSFACHAPRTSLHLQGGPLAALVLNSAAGGRLCRSWGELSAAQEVQNELPSLGSGWPPPKLLELPSKTDATASATRQKRAACDM